MWVPAHPSHMVARHRRRFKVREEAEVDSSTLKKARGVVVDPRMWRIMNCCRTFVKDASTMARMRCMFAPWDTVSIADRVADLSTYPAVLKADNSFAVNMTLPAGKVVACTWRTLAHVLGTHVTELRCLVQYHEFFDALPPSALIELEYVARLHAQLPDVRGDQVYARSMIPHVDRSTM